MKEEQWKPIKGYEGLYEVSSESRIKSLSRTARANVTGVRKIKERILRQSLSSYGYAIVNLSKNGIKKCIQVHRVIASAFIPNPENKPQVNHIDFVRNNNKISNLEWVTVSENAIHSVPNRGKRWGDNAPRSKLSEKTKRRIISIYVDGRFTQSELAKRFDVCQPTISDIVNKESIKYYS